MPKVTAEQLRKLPIVGRILVKFGPFKVAKGKPQGPAPYMSDLKRAIQEYKEKTTVITSPADQSLPTELFEDEGGDTSPLYKILPVKNTLSRSKLNDMKMAFPDYFDQSNRDKSTS